MELFILCPFSRKWQTRVSRVDRVDNALERDRGGLRVGLRGGGTDEESPVEGSTACCPVPLEALQHLSWLAACRIFQHRDRLGFRFTGGRGTRRRQHCVPDVSAYIRNVDSTYRLWKVQEAPYFSRHNSRHLFKPGSCTILTLSLACKVRRSL